MTTKLTLTIEEEVISSAKKYAMKNNRSLSDIVENYLKSISAKETTKASTLSPKIKELLGAVTLPKDFDYKEELSRELTRKHLGK